MTRVRFRSSLRDRPGVRTFYLTSFTAGRETEYALKVIRRSGQRRTTCNCPDFYHARQPVRRVCKHVRFLREYVALVGGVSHIPNGLRIDLTLAEMRRKR